MLFRSYRGSGAGPGGRCEALEPKKQLPVILISFRAFAKISARAWCCSRNRLDQERCRTGSTIGRGARVSTRSRLGFFMFNIGRRLLCIASGIVSRIGAMPSRSRPRPLRHLLILLGCAIVAPLLLLGAYAAVRLADAQLNQIREELMTEARILGIRWMETYGLAYFEDVERARRAARVIGTVADITERKENAEKAHLLTREINHRAKNMLSVVDAISHQIAAGHPQDFPQRFSERIQALSTNQDLLIRNEWKGVEIEDLVRAQLAHFSDVIGPRIAVQGPKLLLRGAAAQAIGLALHELATNAGKYGALSTDAGRVDIRWGCDGDTLTMSWTERDGPLVSTPERRGFGTIVMKAMAERSLDGAVQLDYDPSGVIWRLTCPAVNVLER